MKTFALKVKHFFKRNIYPITITVCTVLVLGIIAISAYSAIAKQNQVVDTNQNVEEQQPSVDPGNDNDGDDVGKEEENKPTDNKDPIIFDLPFSNAEVSKAYAEDILLYDNTTKFWCTHQGIDFACEVGQEVVAVFDGEVVKVESSMMNGKTVYLKISDELTVVYKGLDNDVKVSEGDKIKKGTVIGKVTSFLTEKADGIHLHLELLHGDKLIDPTDYFPFNK